MLDSLKNNKIIRKIFTDLLPKLLIYLGFTYVMWQKHVPIVYMSDDSVVSSMIGGYSLKDYDEYRYGDYRYYISNGYTSDDGWVVTINQEVTDKNQTSYGPILDRIYNRDVSILSETFSGCKNLIIAPAMPQYIERLYYTFSGCTALTTAPDISYCEQLKGMEFTFQGCTSMKTYTGSADADGDFSNYTLPNSVTDMSYAFGTCKQMTHAPAIPENVYGMQGTFNYCTALTNAPDTTNARSIKTMYSCFTGCTALSSTKNLVLPSTVTDIQWAFYNCTSLSGKITINSTPTSYGNSFHNVDMSKITFAGSCDVSVKQAIANIGKNGSQVTIID